MSKNNFLVSNNSSSQPGIRKWLPGTTLGWVAIILALVAIASWVAFPIITMTYRTTYPVVNTWIMPAIATGLVDLAAIMSLAAVVVQRERSILILVMLALTIVAGVFFTAMVVGEGVL